MQLVKPNLTSIKHFDVGPTGVSIWIRDCVLRLGGRVRLGDSSRKPMEIPDIYSRVQIFHGHQIRDQDVINYWVGPGQKLHHGAHGAHGAPAHG